MSHKEKRKPKHGIRSELIDLTPEITQRKPEEWTNICSKCGAENTLYPMWKGRRVLHRCEACGELARGITKAKWLKKKEKERKSE